MKITSSFAAWTYAIRENQIRAVLEENKRFFPHRFDKAVSELTELFVTVLAESEDDAFERGLLSTLPH